VNYTIPLLKVTNSNNESMANDTFSIGSSILSYLGMDLEHPDIILKKEISYFRNDDFSFVSSNNDNAFQPSSDSFNLKDNDITKNNDTSNENNTDVQNNTGQVYDPTLKKTLNPSKPEILIYHSHTTESYEPYGPDNINPTEDVCAVGDELAKDLQDDYGISVIHDKTVHNATDYDGSYVRSSKTVAKYLQQYGDFKMIIDIHRDSLNNKIPDTISINGENVARFEFVMSVANNPHADKNMALVKSLVNIANEDFKGLMCNENIDIYQHGNNSFNQSMSNNAFLLEVGCDKNSLDEAKGTAKYLARILAQQLNGKK
jgi:stage II sporulation protein P